MLFETASRQLQDFQITRVYEKNAGLQNRGKLMERVADGAKTTSKVLEAKVVAFMPSNIAAPASPKIRPLHRAKAARMFFSSSAFNSTSGIGKDNFAEASP